MRRRKSEPVLDVVSHDDDKCSVNGVLQDDVDGYAQSFARALLMPHDDFIAHARLGWSAGQLADRYDVERIEVVRRLRDLDAEIHHQPRHLNS